MTHPQILNCPKCTALRDSVIKLGIPLSMEPVCDDCYMKEMDRILNKGVHKRKHKKWRKE